MKATRTAAVLLSVLLILPSALLAQLVDLRVEEYIEPPEEIARIVTAPWHKNVTLRNLGPDGEHFVIPLRAGLPSVKIYAKPFVNLAEVEFDYIASRARNFTLRRQLGFEIFNWKTGRRIKIVPPKGAWTSSASWSPDGRYVAYYVHTDGATHIYVADARSGKTRRITKRPVLATLVTQFQWAQDSRRILTVLVPRNSHPMPERPQVAGGPEVRITNDGKTPNRTFPNLLRTPYDRALLEWLITGQLALIDVKTRKVQEIGKPAMYREVSLSPDGEYILATLLEKPFAYTVPLRSFGTRQIILNLNGETVAEVQKQKIRYSTVGQRDRQNRNQKRNVQWRPDGQGLSYLQMEPRKGNNSDGEAENGKNKRRDRVIQWLPPFDSTSVRILYESPIRISNVYYSQDCQTLFVLRTEEGKQHLFAVELADTSRTYTIFKHRPRDVYTFPGSLVLKPGRHGGSVVRMAGDKSHIFLMGIRYSKNPIENPPVQFLFRVNFKTGERDTLFMGSPEVWEQFITVGTWYSSWRGPSTTVQPVADETFTYVFTTRESPAMVPDTYARNLQTGEINRLTRNKDYAPEITRARRYWFKVERVDGIRFWVQIILPPDYQEGTRLPAMFWFYPREYTSQKDYDRWAARYHNPIRFPRVSTRSMEILTKLGYAVVRPDCPIIGPSGRMNDNYVPDLRNNLWAVIDYLDKKGFIDRDRLGIGGHSYGAFGTANALIHTPFFKAGIAGDGNYNRSLTPITFQTERRLLWEAREVYIRMSPLFWANQLNGALLMYHGLDDNNVGTFPINSERMFHVLDGLGKTAALYLYPYEHHGPATRETLLDLWARWIKWLDTFVKHPEKGKKIMEERRKEHQKSGERLAVPKSSPAETGLR